MPFIMLRSCVRITWTVFLMKPRFDIMSGSIVCVKLGRLPPARFAIATLQTLVKLSVGHQWKQVRPSISNGCFSKLIHRSKTASSIWYRFSKVWLQRGSLILLTNLLPYGHSITLHLVLSLGVPFPVELAVDLRGTLLALGVDGDDLSILLFLDDYNDVRFSEWPLNSSLWLRKLLLWFFLLPGAR